MRLTTAGIAFGLGEPVVGLVSKMRQSEEDRHRCIFVGPLDGVDSFEFLKGYRGVITTSGQANVERAHRESGTPLIYSVREDNHLEPGYAVVMQPGSGFVRTLYRPESSHNAIFVTERCNSNCLMCSQPPKDHDDGDLFVRTNLELIKLIDPTISYMGITGGEPTLLGDGLFRLVAALRDTLQVAHVHMLTNGRLFAWKDFTRRFSEIKHPRLTLGIPIYSDDPVQHDYVVQAKHAFDQTVMGLHALASWNTNIELRIVLHRLSVPRLAELALYIYRNFPFVGRVALMGLEPTGYTPRNRERLWIDPVDYQNELEEAVEILSVRGMNVSLYNLQLCILRPSLWKYARRSISDWKNIYLPECHACGALNECGGLFQSATKMHSNHIHPIGLSNLQSDLGNQSELSVVPIGS